jgi:hypothetical protein
MRGVRPTADGLRAGPAAERHLFVRLRRPNTRLERAGLGPAAQPRAPLDAKETHESQAYGQRRHRGGRH